MCSLRLKWSDSPLLPVVWGVGEILDAKDMSEFLLAQMVEKTAALYRS